MAKERFESFKLKQESLDLIAKINGIIVAYQEMGYRMTVRQIYYQLVKANLIPNNKDVYDSIVALVTKGRLMGLIDWDAVEDRTREQQSQSAWSTPRDILESSAACFRTQRWDNQPYFMAVLIEKEALSNVIWPVCEELGITFMANRGYASASALYELGKRLQFHRDQRRKHLRVLYLGDHDPSGIDMTRDVRERLEMFSRGPVTVERIALNMDQIEEHQPPENPAKSTDSRYQAYIDRFGESSWELDALSPPVLDALVRQAVAEVRDDELYRARQRREGRMRRELLAFMRTAGAKGPSDYDDPEDYEESFLPYEVVPGGELGGVYEDDEAVAADLEPVAEEDEE